MTKPTGRPKGRPPKNRDGMTPETALQVDAPSVADLATPANAEAARPGAGLGTNRPKPAQAGKSVKAASTKPDAAAAQLYPAVERFVEIGSLLDAAAATGVNTGLVPFDEALRLTMTEEEAQAVAEPFSKVMARIPFFRRHAGTIGSSADFSDALVILYTFHRRIQDEGRIIRQRYGVPDRPAKAPPGAPKPNVLGNVLRAQHKAPTRAAQEATEHDSTGEQEISNGYHSAAVQPIPGGYVIGGQFRSAAE